MPESSRLFRLVASNDLCEPLLVIILLDPPEVDVGLVAVVEMLARKRAVKTLGFVERRYVLLNAYLMDQAIRASSPSLTGVDERRSGRCFSRFNFFEPATPLRQCTSAWMMLASTAKLSPPTTLFVMQRRTAGQPGNVVPLHLEALGPEPVRRPVHADDVPQQSGVSDAGGAAGLEFKPA